MFLTLFAQTNAADGVTEAGRSVVEAGRDMSGRVVSVGQETWAKVSAQVTELVGGYAPNIAAALLVLLVGWVIAMVIAALVRSTIRRLKLDERFAQSMDAAGGASAARISTRAGKGAFYLVMLLVLVAFFQTLGLTMVTEPLNGFLNQVFEYAPRMIAAGVVFFVAWVVANACRYVVSKVLTTAKLDRRLSREAGVDGDDDLPVAKTMSDAQLLAGLPAVLTGATRRAGSAGAVSAGSTGRHASLGLPAELVCRSGNPRHWLVRGSGCATCGYEPVCGGRLGSPQ